jgi:thiamine transport system substrate-binding protein
VTRASLVRTSKVMVAAAAIVLSACSGGGASPSPSGPLTLLTHDAFAISDPVLAEFDQQHGTTVKVLRAGDAGAMVNQAILTKDAPLADVLYGVDNTFLSRALDAGIFEPYQAAELDQVPQQLRLDAQDRVTPIDYGDVCLAYDKKSFSGTSPTGANPPPSSLEDLTRPQYRSQLVVENPATSSPGLAFLLATIVRFGESGSYTWQDYWRALRANDVEVTADWETAYYTSFSGGSGEGDRPIVVSYATDPAAAVVDASPRPAESPVGVVIDGCFRQVEFAGVLAGTHQADLAHAFIDYMLSPTFQDDIPLNMYVFPAHGAAQPPAVFVQYAAVVSQPIQMDPAQITANRDRWIQEWTDVVLH